MDDHTPKEPLFPDFTNPLNRGEQIAAWIYLPLHVAVLPLLLSLLAMAWPDGDLSELKLNVYYYAAGCIYMLVLLRGSLRRSFDAVLDRPGAALAALLAAAALYFILSWGVGLAALALSFDLTDPPNNDLVLDMADANFWLVFVLVVVIAPIVEEPLFRGAVFGSLYRRSRWAAYVVSVAIFSLYHVWQYAAAYGDVRNLVYALGYIPASVALAYCYERTGSLWTPILFHAAINAFSMLASGG